MSRIYHNKFLAMNTRFHVIFPEMDDENGDRFFAAIKQEVNRIENKLSRFIPDSDVAKLNKKAAAEAVKADDEFFEIMNACRVCWEITEGGFDPTLRPLMEFWKSRTGEEETEEELANIQAATGMEKVQMDPVSKTIQFETDDLEIDLGGFGKGYALEKVKHLLNDASVKNAFISFGESSILALGQHPAGGDWKIGMNDYLNPGQSLHRFYVSGGSVSTSSNFFVSDNGRLKNHRHVIDPRIGQPVERCCSVSVSAESPVLAEMLSTAFLVSPDEVIYEVMSQYENLEVIKVDYESGRGEVTEFEPKKADQIVHEN
jgi:FAD:protein FMN transferase